MDVRLEEGLSLPVGELLTEGLALLEMVILLVVDALTEGVGDTLSGGVTLVEGVSLTERVTDGDIDIDPCGLLVVVVVLLIVDVGLKDFVWVRDIEGVRVDVLEVEGGTPMVPAKL